MQLNERLDVVFHRGPLRLFSESSRDSAAQHAPQQDAPMPPSLWQRLRLFEIHDRLRLWKAVDALDVEGVRRALADKHCNVNVGPKDCDPPIVHAVGTSSMQAILRGAHNGEPGVQILDLLLTRRDLKLDNRAWQSADSAAERAVYLGHMEALRQLRPKDKDWGATPNGGSLLALATHSNRIEAVAVLLEGSLPDTPHRREPKGDTAFVTAAKAGWTDILKLFLEHGAAPDMPDSRGDTALKFAVQAGNLDMVKLLLRHGADTQTLVGEKRSVIDDAAMEGDGPVLAALLAATEAPQEPGSRALSHAVANGHANCIGVVLDDPRIKLDAVQLALLRALVKDWQDPMKWALHPDTILARRGTPEELEALMTTAPQRVAHVIRLMGQLASNDALHRLNPLGTHLANSAPPSPLEATVASEVEFAGAQSRWLTASALTQVLEPHRWTPSDELLRKTCAARGAGEANRAARRTLACALGDAQLSALRRSTDCQSTLEAWQSLQQRPNLPARLATVVMALTLDPSQLDGLKSDLERLFELRDVDEDQRAHVAKQALLTLERFNGPGIQLDPFNVVEYSGSTRGDYQFRVAGDVTAKGWEPATHELVKLLNQHLGAVQPSTGN